MSGKTALDAKVRVVSWRRVHKPVCQGFSQSSTSVATVGAVQAVAFDFDGTITTGKLGSDPYIFRDLDSTALDTLFGGSVRIAKLALVLRLLQEHGVRLYIVSLGDRTKIIEWLSDDTVGLCKFFEERIYGSEDVGMKPKYQLIQERIMAPSSMDRDNLLFVDNDFERHLAAAAPFCQTYHVKGSTGLTDADVIRICDAVGIKDAMLHVAAEHVKPLFLKPYRKNPPPGVSDELRRHWEIDLHAVHGVERPNHALANGLRKALLVPPLVEAYRKHETSGNFGKEAFEFGPKLEQAMQVAVLFEKCCRESDISYECEIGPNEYAKYDNNSMKAFSEFMTQAGFSNDEKVPLKQSLNGVKLMYQDDRSAMVHVFEMAHGLDCLRCYSTAEMESRLTTLEERLGADCACRLVTMAEDMLRATGDRVMCSPSEKGRAEYQKELFFKSNTNVIACIEACRSVVSTVHVSLVHMPASSAGEPAILGLLCNGR
jgi:hypothetical protein